MKKEWSSKLSIDNISKINIHHQSSTNFPVNNIIQLESGVIAIGLNNGTINFFSLTSLEVPYICFKVDAYPINSLIQIEEDQILCNSGPYLYILFDTKKNSKYDKKEKISIENIQGNINRILLLYDKSFLITDDKYISLFKKEKRKFNLIKHLKINSPITNICQIQNSLIIALVPLLQKILFIDPEKLVQTYQIQNIKFYPNIKYNNIICRISKDYVIIGGCMGHVYMINIKNKQLIANVSIRYKNEIITCMYLMNNGDLLCGSSMIVNDEETQQEYICSNLVQYRYDKQTFKEIYRKKNVHEDLVQKIIEIVNHKGINEFASVSLDGKFKIWN